MTDACRRVCLEVWLHGLISVGMVAVRPVHGVQLGQGPETRPPVIEEVVIQVRPGGGALERAEAPGQRLGPLVAVDVQRVVGDPVPVVVGLVFPRFDHYGHVVVAGGGRRVLVGFLYHGVEGGVVRVAQHGAVMAGRGQDGDVVATRETQGWNKQHCIFSKVWLEVFGPHKIVNKCF